MSMLPKDGEVLFYPGFFSLAESDRFFATLLEEIDWRQESIQLYGKRIPQPRLVSWHGEHSYRYSGLTLPAQPWTPTLREIQSRIESVARVRFTGILLNRYRDGRDSMGWHRDNEKELGRDPVIGSVSLGATRDFRLRHFVEKHLKVSVPLTHGSFLLMRGATQHCWEHAIPKQLKITGERINLTFRVLR